MQRMHTTAKIYVCCLARIKRMLNRYFYTKLYVQYFVYYQRTSKSVTSQFLMILSRRMLT